MTRQRGCPNHGKAGCGGTVDDRGKCEKCFGGVCLSRKFELSRIAKKRERAK